jgi:hypothetical protein
VDSNHLLGVISERGRANWVVRSLEGGRRGGFGERFLSRADKPLLRTTVAKSTVLAEIVPFVDISRLCLVLSSVDARRGRCPGASCS